MGKEKTRSTAIGDAGAPLVLSGAVERAVKGGVIICLLACVVGVMSGLMARVIPNGDLPQYYQGGVYPPGKVAAHDFWQVYTYAGVLLGGGDIKNLPPTIPATMKEYFAGPINVSNYPPFIFMLYAGYHLLGYAASCSLHLFILILANLFVLGSALWLVNRIAADLRCGDVPVRMIMGLAVGAATAMVLFESYGFEFSFERGNCDILSMVFAWLFLCVLITRPDRIWWQVILLSCAIHIKITPAILVALVLWKHRGKAILPLAVVNVALLLCWGPKNAWIFAEALTKFAGAPDAWWGNHAAYSFAALVLKPALGISPAAGEKLLILLIFALWVISLVVLVRRGLSPLNQLLLFMASVPVMSMVPNSSNDYKLVILYAPIAVMMWIWLYGYIYKRQSGVLILVLFLLLYFLGKSGIFSLSSSVFWSNKFWIVLVLQGMLLGTIMRSARQLESKL